MHVCPQSAAAAADPAAPCLAILLLLLLLLLFVIVHLPPEGVLHTNSSNITYCQSAFIANENALVHP